MTELKGIKLEDLNVTKETFIKLIGLLNLDLELPDDERIIFDESVEKCESGQVIAFYHLLVYGDKLYNFCLSFFLNSLSCNSSYLSGYNVDTCDFSLLDCLYKSGILTSVEEEDNPEQTPAEDAEEQSEIIDTNMGAMPIEDYHDILAYQHGFDSYEEFKKAWCSDDEEFNTSELKLPPAEENKQTDELTSLELILFEEHQKCLSSSISYLNMAHEAESEDEHDMYLSDASSATLIFGYISKIINQACLAGKYSAWLQERKEQKAVGAN